MYFIQHCFICRPSNFTVSEDAGIEPRTIAVRRSNLSARSYPQTRLDLIHINISKMHFQYFPNQILEIRSPDPLTTVCLFYFQYILLEIISSRQLQYCYPYVILPDTVVKFFHIHQLIQDPS